MKSQPLKTVLNKIGKGEIWVFLSKVDITYIENVIHIGGTCKGSRNLVTNSHIYIICTRVRISTYYRNRLGAEEIIVKHIFCNLLST